MAVLNPILKRKDVVPWWKCPSDRELALRAKIKVGYSTIAGRANVNKYAPIIGTAPVRGLSVEELDIIEDVVARSAQIERMNEMRNSSLILQYDELKRRCEGDGVSTCILCGYDFNQPHNNERSSICYICNKIVCLHCKYEEKEFGELICLCPICFEGKELWRKTGAWLMSTLPRQTFSKKELEELINKSTENKHHKSSLDMSNIALGERIRMTETEESMLEEDDIEEFAKDGTLKSFNSVTFQDRDDSSRPPSQASTSGWDNLDELRRSSGCVEEMIIAQDRRASSSHRGRSSVILDKPLRPSSTTTPSNDQSPSPPPSPPQFGLRRSFAMSPSQRRELAKCKPGAKLLQQQQTSTDSEERTSHSPYPDSESSLDVGGELLVIRQSLDESSDVPLILVSEPSIHLEDKSDHHGDDVSEQNNEEVPHKLKRKNATRRSKRKNYKDDDLLPEGTSDLNFSQENPSLPNDSSELRFPGRQNKQESDDFTLEPQNTTSELTITINEPEDTSELIFSMKEPDSMSELTFPLKEPEDTSDLMFPVKEPEDTSELIFSMKEPDSMSELTFPLKEPEDTSEVMFPVKDPEDTSELIFPMKEPDGTPELTFPVKKPENTSELMFPVKEPEDTSELMFPVIPVKEPEDTSELMFPVKEPEDTSELIFPVIPVKEPEDTSELTFPVIPVKEPEDTSELIFPVIPIKKPEDTSELTFPVIPVKKPEDTSELMFPVKEPEDTSELTFPVIPVKEPEDKHEQKEMSELTSPVKESIEKSELTYPVKILENKTETGFASEEKETPTPTPEIKPRRRTLIIKATEHTDPPPSHEDHSNMAQKQDGGYSWKRRNATRSGGNKSNRNSTASTSETDLSSGASVSGDDTLKRKREKARLAARRLRKEGGVSESRRKRNDDNDLHSPDNDEPRSPDDGPRSPERLI